MDISKKRFLLRTVIAVVAIASLTIGSCESDEDQTRLPANADPAKELGVESRGSSALRGTNPEPRHGGIVHSVDRFNVEVASGPVRIWLYDHRGSQVSPERIDGQLVLYRGEESATFDLDAISGHLTPSEQPDLGARGMIFVELMVDDRPIDVVLELPLPRSEGPTPVDAG